MAFQSNRAVIKPSLALIVLGILCHFLALLSILLVADSYWLLLAVVLVIISLFSAAKKYFFLLASDSVVGLDWDPIESWLWLKNGERIQVEISAKSVVWPTALLLLAEETDRESSRSFKVLLLPGSLDSQSRRRLRVALRFKKFGVSAATGS